MGLSYNEAVEWLDGLQRRKWHAGLERMEKLLELLGLESYAWGQARPDYYHVAGTNGKGSTTAFLEALLSAHGVKTGAAASPYVYDVCERVRIGSAPIARDDFARHTSMLMEADALLQASPFEGGSAFEMKTALGFLHWHECAAQAVALEVGMGGRIDATNVVQPKACVIVSIGWDHMDVLGDTLGKIASEKAGIIKPGLPVVVGAMEEEPLSQILLTAQSRGAPAWVMGRDIAVEHGADGSFSASCPEGSWSGLRTRMFGSVQAHNAALALACLASAGFGLQDGLVREALAEASWPGRFEEHEWEGTPVVLDGAHNQSAALVLADALRARFPGRRVGLVVGMLRGHEPGPFLSALAALGGPMAFVTAPTPRGLPAGWLRDKAALVGIAAPASESPLHAAVHCMEQGAEALCFCGSFYILAGVKDDLGLNRGQLPA